MWPFSKKTPDTTPTPNTKLVAVTKATKAQPEIMEEYKDGNGALAKSIEENSLHTSELIFSCVDYISKAASQAILTIEEVNPKTGDTKPIRDKALIKWSKSPNAFQSWGDMIELTLQGILLGGGSFITHELVKGRYESWFLGPPSNVKIVPHTKKFIEGYIYNDKIAYKQEEVCYIRNPTLNNAYYGVPAVRPLLDTLLLEGYAINELKEFYEGSSLLSGILQSEFNLSPEQIAEIRTQFKELYGKDGRSRGGTAVLPAKLTYKPIQANPKDAQLLESLQISDRRVLRVFKLNALALGGEAASTTHPQELMRMVFNTAVRPYLYKIEDQLTIFLQEKMKNENLKVSFDYDRITELETSLDVKSTAAKTLYSTGIASLNESRDMVGLTALSDDLAKKHALPAFLFGENIAYIEDGIRAVDPTVDGSAPGSTDPAGGDADLTTAIDNNSNNGGD